MAGYFGTDQQRALQRTVDERTPWCKATKGAVNGGRFLGTDDPEALGWPQIIDLLDKGGAFTFRMVPRDALGDLQARLAKHGIRFDHWSVFAGDAESIARQVGDVLRTPLPDGLSLIDPDELTDPPTLSAVQAFMAQNGVAPFSGMVLSGQALPSVLVAIRDGADRIVATAFGYFPYNRFSRWFTTAWGGLVAVDPARRGQRIGLWVNARMLSECIGRLKAHTVQEYAAETNLPSRRMIERCGLVLDPSVVSGIATSGADRFTR